MPLNSRRSVFTALVIVCLDLLASRPAAAQVSQPLRLGLGYQFLHVSFDGDGETFPVGVYADIGRALTSDEAKAFDWMGQLEAHFRNGDGFSEQLYTFLGGIRLTSTKPLKWTPSGHGLIGFGRINASCAEFCGGAFDERVVLVHRNGAAFQAGIAVSTRITDRMAGNVGFKATKVKFESSSLFNTAVSVGVRINLGG